MTENKPNPNPETSSGSGAEELVGGLTNVILAALGVGIDLAKTAAQATAGGRAVPGPDSVTNPLKVISHYGMATAMNIINVVTSSVNEINDSTRKTRPQEPSAKSGAADTPAAAQSGLPAVHLGAILRIPLSIENPGNEPMNDLHFVCVSLEGGSGEGNNLPLQAIRLEPTVLTVAPHDFEKLTVFITVPTDAALGRYQTRIRLEGGGFETTLEFEVLPAAN